MLTTPRPLHWLILVLAELVLWGAAGCALAQGHGAASLDGRRLEIDIDYESPQARPIPRAFLGTNNLYWIDDKKAWADPAFVEALRTMGIRALRFPGGEVADNYDWKRNRLERLGKFPYEKQGEQLDDRTDWLTFLENATRSGIKSFFFVVNLEGAFLAPGDRSANIERYARLAAEWVLAVKRAGHFVEHWEIGNESDIPTAFPLTAEEYARAFIVFARHMKAADPRIKLGAVGPMSMRPDWSVSFKDALSPRCRALLAERSVSSQGSACAGQTERDCAIALCKEEPRKEYKAAWWQQFLPIAGSQIDFVAPHRYGLYKWPNKAGPYRQPPLLGQHMREFKAALRTATKRPVEVALTEYNAAGGRTPKAVTGQDYAIDMMEQLMHFVAGDVDNVLVWPLRYETWSRALLEPNRDNLALPGRLLAFFHKHLDSRLVADAYDTTYQVYALVTSGLGTRTILMINRSMSPATVLLTAKLKSLRRVIAADTFQTGTINRERKMEINFCTQIARCIYEIRIPGRAVGSIQLVN